MTRTVQTPSSLEPARFGWFEGHLEGPRRDVAALRRLRTSVDGLELARTRLYFEGDRFRLTFEEGAFGGKRLDDARLRALAFLLQEMMKAATDPNGCTSTLRCSVVTASEVHEIDFEIADDTVQRVVRSRPIAAADLERAPRGRDKPIAAGFGARHVVPVLVSLTIALGLLFWHSEVLERMFAVPSDRIEVDLGPFATMVTARVGDAGLGSYVVEVRRGSSFPATDAARDRQLEAASTIAQRAAVRAVANGGELSAQLLDEAGNVLAFEPIPLSPLQHGDDAVADCRLPGRRDAHGLRLALEPGGDH